MATLYSMKDGVDGWVTLTLIPPVTRLKCIVWVFSLLLGSIDARTWGGYRLYGLRPPDGSHWQFQSGDGAAITITDKLVNYNRYSYNHTSMSYATCLRSVHSMQYTDLTVVLYVKLLK